MTMASIAVNQVNQTGNSTIINNNNNNNNKSRYHLQSNGIINHNNNHNNNSSSNSSTTVLPSITNGKNYDTLGKGKKSWSVRLGLSRQGHINDNIKKQGGWDTISGGSALSRQMRYGDPWLYGTVRSHRKNIHDNNRGSIIQTGYIGRPPPSATSASILVVCSCPEFLTGTTRRLGNCKKCGGHRLAGLPFGGTCRAPSTSSRTRPSLAGILKQPLDDPYDVMRRSRLVEPRSRARSISPHRQNTTRDSRSQSVAISNNNHQRTEWFISDNNFANKNDSWPMEEAGRRNSDENRSDSTTNLIKKRSDKNNKKRLKNIQRDVDGRKSILECDVNPYLLVKKQIRDEDDFSDDLSDNALEIDEPLPNLFDPSKVKSIERIPARCSVAAIGGQRIRVFNEPREISDEDDDTYELANNGVKINNDNDDMEDQDYSDDDKKIIKLNHSITTSIPIPKISPKRPPRKQKIDNKNFVPVKSILKRLKGNNKSGGSSSSSSSSSNNNNGKKKSVLFNVDNVIFAPVKTDFNINSIRRSQGVKSLTSGNSNNNNNNSNSNSSSNNNNCQEINFEERNEEQSIRNERDERDLDENEDDDKNDEDEEEQEPEAHIITKPKFITIPNIKDPPNNKQNEKIFSNKIDNNGSLKNLVKNDKLKSSGIPKSVNHRTNNINNYDKVITKGVKLQDNLLKTEAIEPICKHNNEKEEQEEEEEEITIDNKIRPEDETELEIEIEELKVTHDEISLNQHNGVIDKVRRSGLQRSQSERIVHNVEHIDDIPFTDTMRLSVRKRQRRMKSESVNESEEINNDDFKTTLANEDTADKNYHTLDKSSLDHFQRMRPTSWSPPPSIKHKNLPQNRSSDPGMIDFKFPISSSSASKIKTSYQKFEKTPKVGISPSRSENVFKITVSPIQSPLVHRLQIGSSDITTANKGSRRTSIMINGDQNLNSETSSDNKVTISVGGEDSVCNPTVISVNSDVSPKIKSSSENRTLVILDNYSSNIIVEPSSKEARLSRSYSEGSDDSLERSNGSVTPTDKRQDGHSNHSHNEVVQLRKCQTLSKEAVVSKLLEDSLKKARRNGEILDETSGEAILKILKETLLKSNDYESSESTVEPDTNYSRSSSLNSEGDFVPGNIYIDENPYEVIKEPIYEEIPDEPPPLPLSPPPLENYPKEQIYFGEEYKDAYYKKFNSGQFLRSYFPDDFFKKPTTDELTTMKKLSPDDNYAPKFELYNYLIDSKEPTDLIEEEEDAEGELEALYEQKETSLDDLSSKSSQISNVSDSSEENNIHALANSNSPETLKMRTVDIERTDSGVGSESSQASSSRGAVRRWRGSNNGGSSSGPGSILGGMPQVISGDVKLCQDCEQRLDPLVTISGVVYAPFVCRKCSKKRSERKEIIMEIVETEQKYGRDLQIILEEFYRPMLRAGLLTQDQLSAIFLNVEELLEHNVILAEKLRDAVDYVQEAGDEDLITMDVGKIFLESEGMLHAFESYCTRQGGASLLLQNLEKEKELLRIFLKVSQMENTVLRRMNLNSFLMVPVQRVTKYPLLLARLFKATPSVRPDIQIAKNKLKQAQTNIELHLEHMNAEARDVTSTKLWRRISIIQNGRRSMGEQDMVNIKLRKMAVDVLEWAHEEVRFALEGRLLVAVPTDNNWRRGKTVKLVPVTAMLVTNGKPNNQFLDITDDSLFPRQIGIKEATLLLVKEKIGRYSLLREPLYLDKCIVCCEADLEDYFEIQELSSKETFIFKAEDGARTKRWCRTLQAHAQSLGAWRRRRGALANIMICGVARN